MIISFAFTFTLTIYFSFGARLQRQPNTNTDNISPNLIALSHQESTNLLPATYFETRYHENNILSARQDTNESEPTSETKIKPLGYLFDPCSLDDDCVGDRICVNGFNQNNYCEGAGVCFCLYALPEERYHEFNITEELTTPAYLYQECTTCKECDFYPNETCQVHPRGPKEETGLCISSYVVYEGIQIETDCNSYPEITPLAEIDENLFRIDPLSNTFKRASPSPFPSVAFNSTATPSLSAIIVGSSTDEDKNCIDINSLKHLKPAELVYESHKLAGVFCDQYNSCATPGHMVIYHGTAMSMKSYCSKLEIKCNHQVKHVNSPKFSKGLRITSATHNLQFTAFAASHETMLEEYILRQVIHMGL